MTMTISPDDLAYLATLQAQEQETLASLRAARGSFEAHLAKKYRLTAGDQVQPDGSIVRAADAKTQE